MHHTIFVHFYIFAVVLSLFLGYKARMAQLFYAYARIHAPTIFRRNATMVHFQNVGILCIIYQMPGSLQ